MNFEPLLVEDVIELHDYAIERYGGLPGIRDSGCVEFVTEKPFQVIFGTEMYPGLFLKAAVYMQSFTVGHCFSDGNKRTGYFAATIFLEINGFSLIVDDEDLYNHAIAVAKKEIDIEELAIWLEANSQQIEEMNL